MRFGYDLIAFTTLIPSITSTKDLLERGHEFGWFVVSEPGREEFEQRAREATYLPQKNSSKWLYNENVVWSSLVGGRSK